MRTTTVYLVDRDDASTHEVARPTLKEARDAARDEVVNTGHRSRIIRVTVPLVPVREAVCNLLNDECYVLERELVETYVPENVVMDYFEPDGPRWSFRVEGRE